MRVAIAVVLHAVAAPDDLAAQGRVGTRLDLQLVSWTRRGFDTVRRDPTDVLARLTRALAAGDILIAHDGNAARAEDGSAVLLAVLPELLARAKSLGLVAVTLPAASLHPRGDDALAPAEATASASP